MDMTRWLYRRRGTVTGPDGLAREGSYFADEFIRPDQISPDWLKMSVKQFVRWLYNEGSYEGDPEQYKAVEHWEDPAEFIARKLKGDCEAFAVTVASFLIAKGHPDTRICLGKKFHNKEAEVKESINHAWVLVYGHYPGKDTITLIDATAPRSKLLGWPYIKRAERSWGYKPYISFSRVVFLGDGAYFEHWR